MSTTTPAPFDLATHGLTVTEIHHNLSPSRLYEHAICFEKDASIAENGALVAYSGAKTGRSPKDKRVVKNSASEKEIWWGPVNIPCDERTFQINRQRALDYLNTRERLYCFDGFAGWDPKYRIRVRVICSRPYHALFMHTMLGGPFLMWHPSRYADLLAEKMRKHNARVWLVNTGWGGGSYGVSRRISLKNTRAIIDAIHSGTLASAKTERDPVFGFDIVTEVPDVSSDILRPRESWAEEAAYDATAKKLAGLFNNNFETYAAGISAEVKAAAPVA
jgi:ATP-dependent phosphoenolpyruvate carboxykinase